MIKIAIDGPSGAGKSSLAKRIAKELNIIYIDTGALYRSVGLWVCRKGIAVDDTAAIIASLDKIKVELGFDSNGGQRVYLCGEDVSELIRTPEIAKYASAVSAIAEVRALLFDMQREIADKNSVVMDGRDIGTVILPDADVKIFLSASDRARAQRRCKELREKGEECSVEDILNAMKERDRRDSTREIAPAVAAADAVLLDNSELDFEASVQAALDIIKSKTEK
ncbi:MAG: (d)CMP kinase [Clostridia bacterium]|nr:(d)CMP kinase [Clostridia bacterium]